MIHLGDIGDSFVNILDEICVEQNICYTNKKFIERFLLWDVRDKLGQSLLTYVWNYIKKLLRIDSPFWAVAWSHNFSSSSCYRTEEILIIHEYYRQLISHYLKNKGKYDFSELIKLIGEFLRSIKKDLEIINLLEILAKEEEVKNKEEFDKDAINELIRNEIILSLPDGRLVLYMKDVEEVRRILEDKKRRLAERIIKMLEASI